MFRLGLGLFKNRSTWSWIGHILDGLKLFYPFKRTKVSHASSGSTSFDGTDDYVDMGVSPRALIGNSNPFTVSVWVKANDDDNEYIIGSMESGAERFYLRFRDPSGGTAYLRWGYGETGDSNTDAVVTLNTWHHVAWTYDSSSAKLYIDGILKNTQSISGQTISNTDNLFIGAINSNGTASNFFNGSIANVGIWSRALSASEVQGVMYKKYADLSSADQVSLVSWYGLDAESLGSELVSNGTFDTDTTGWTADGTATLSVDTNRLKIDCSSTSGASNTVTGLTANKTYSLSIDVTNTGSNAVNIEFNNNGSYSYLGSVSGENTETKTLTFTANSTSVVIRPYKTTGGIGYFDNVSIKELTLDDSQGTNHGSPVGSTTNATVYGGNAPSKPRIADSAPDVVDNYGTLHSGTALSFDGSNDYVEAGASNATITGNNVTYSVWIKNTDSDESYVLQNQKGAGSSNLGIRVNSTAGDVVALVWNGSSHGTVSYNPSINDSKWHHIAFTTTASAQVLYIDGVSVATGTLTFANASSTDKFQIGRLGSNSTFFGGSLSSLKVFNSALTLAQIQEMYLNPEQILPTGVASSNLKLWLPLQEGSGTTNYDGSGNNNDGTISGATWVKAETEIAQVGLVRQNKPMVFDGSNDEVRFTGITIPKENWATQVIFTWGASASTADLLGTIDQVYYSFIRFASTTSLVIEPDTDGQAITLSTQTMVVGKTYDIVLTGNASGTQLYINGSLDVSTSTALYDDITIERIGYGYNGSWMAGIIHSVGLYDTALTATEVTALYNSGTPLDASADSGNYASSIGLQGYWRNDGDTTWEDRTPLGAYGSELVSNGTFDTDTTGWSASNYTISHESSSVGGRSNIIKCVDGGGYSRIYNTTGNLVSGRTYTITFDAYHTGTTPNNLAIYKDVTSTAPTSYTIIGASPVSPNWDSITYTFVATTTNVAIGYDGSSNAYFDNVSVKRYRGGNDGTVAGSPTSIVLTEGITSGRDSQGFYLKDTDENVLTLNGAEYAEVPHSSAIDPTTAWTLEAWINRNELGVQHSIIEKFDGIGSNGSYVMRVTSLNKLTGYVMSGTSSNSIGGATTIAIDTWYHVALTFDSVANTLVCYVNGAVDGTNAGASINPIVSTLSLKIGAKGTDASTPFNGLIDDARIYSDALSATEVLKNYNAGLSKHS